MAEIRLSGIGVSEGIRIGKVIRYDHSFHNQQFGNVSVEDVAREIKRLADAKAICVQEINQLIEQAQQTVGAEKAGVIQAQKSFLLDPSFCPEMEKLISKKMFSAEKAADQIVKKVMSIFENMPNEYMRERAADVRDVGNRLLAALTGAKGINLGDIREAVILIAEDLAPTDTVQLNKKYIHAFVTQKGGKTSHTAIFSKTLGIPAVIGIGVGLDQIQDGETIIVDGTSGICIVNPEEDTIRIYSEKMAKEVNDESALEAYASKEAVTKDGYRVEIGANIGTATDALYAVEQGAEGIGLLRTELIYMSEDSLPDEARQFKVYRDIVEVMGDKPVIIRTLDIGGDKELSYLKIPKEMNPFLGYRAIRLCLDQKPLFVTQLRAILRASAYGKVKVMFPMISCLEEWRIAKGIVEEVKEQLRAEGNSFDEGIEVGIMVEVPSVAILAKQFAIEVDFFSIGTNDLVQYTLAVDRMNEKIDYLYDHFNPAIISLLQNVVTAAHAEGKFVGMCGGMAGDPKAVPLLLALGLDELSMSATAIRKVKHTINQIELEKCRRLLEDVLQMNTAQDIRLKMESFCSENGI
ncbi:phosphoenolpyruvate--protein phosphotransferase [Sporomusa malonica]|uniref:Phosphoenolpyruvate-protein phosphotransferase n=1 Tax=Sporomusa malonica TaxID=112901 RepID=A0A1W1ZW56_9FIRM|nr:phosphoenolpyruvate--protein phosphotransferase [Sporomusa malonica]SMC52644.1 phosphoenolpyruvate--protein phosphotransferase [Sporomusa malonica]